MGNVPAWRYDAEHSRWTCDTPWEPARPVVERFPALKNRYDAAPLLDRIAWHRPNDPVAHAASVLGVSRRAV